MPRPAGINGSHNRGIPNRIETSEGTYISGNIGIPFWTRKCRSYKLIFGGCGGKPNKHLLRNGILPTMLEARYELYDQEETRELEGR